MGTNNAIIEKAAMTLSDLASGGKLNVTQSNQFLRKIIDAPTIINSARFVPMNGDAMKIESIGFGQRILRAGTEGVQLDDADRAKPTTGTINLAAKEFIAEINITYDTLENNIEKDNLYNLIISMMAERASLDLEELIVNGDTAVAGTDPYLGLIDGIRKKAITNTVDGLDAPLTKDIFKKAIKAIPKKYYRNPADWLFYSSYNNVVEYMDSIASRQTILGDKGVEGYKATAFGTPVQGIAMLQPYAHATKQVSDLLLCHPKNIIIGMSRDIRLEFWKDIRQRKFVIVLTGKVDVQYEREDAVVKVTNVLDA